MASATASVVPPEARWPRGRPGSLIFLLPPSSALERRMVEDWMARNRPAEVDPDAVEVMPTAPPGLEARLWQGDDPLLAPIQVVWLPRERDGTRAARLSDLLRGNPRRPSDRAQERIVREEPERSRVVVGEPATTSELRERFEGPREGFADFVRRRATLALARAERDLIGTQYKVPRLVFEEITDSARFRDGVARLAAELGRAEAEVENEAATALDEMVASQSRLAADIWSQFGRWLSRAYRISLDAGRLEELRALGQRHALVFLPSHRSYLDPLMLRPVLLRHGFPSNHVLGGINAAFWPIGPVTRRTGYVFIRRSFRDDPIYKWVLREYMAYLVRKRFNLEWYIEGGRTRTGKLRPPRYGLLSYLVEGFREGSVEDVYLVPVSITYDQLYEVGAMAAESRGATKRKESFGWLVGYARAQGRGLGRVHIAFGEPLSLRESLEASGPAKVGDGAGAEEVRLAVQKTAFEVSHRINAVTPITPTALVTLALLGVEDRALTLAGIGAILDPLTEYVAARGLPMTVELRTDREAGIRRTLEALASSGVVTCYEGGAEPVYAIGSDQHLVAAFYRNNAIHFFVNRAIAELITLAAAEERFARPLTDAWKEALRLRDLLKFEFFFAEKRVFRDELRGEMELIDPAWESRATTREQAAELLAAARPYLAHRVLRSFLEAYQVVADGLAARDPGAPIVREAFLEECVGVGRQYRMQQRIWGPESISKDLFATAVKLADNRGLLEPGADDLDQRRRAFASEMSVLVARVATIRDLALQDLEPAARPEP